MISLFPSLGLAVISPEVDCVREADEEDSGFEDLGNFGVLDSFLSGVQRVDLDFDSLHAGDVSVWRSRLNYRQEHEKWNIEASVGHNDISVDYSDPVGLTDPTLRDANSWSGSLTLGKSFSEDLLGTIGFSAYNGYNDYASVWIAEYYDQFIGIPDPANYQEPNPHGYSINGGFVWDYDPGVARLSFLVSFGNDVVVPAWSLVPNPDNFFIPEAVSTRSSFDTYSASAIWVKALNPRLRTQVSWRFLDVTELEPRYQIQNDWAWALNDRLTLRAQVGRATQTPEFDAHYGGVSLSYEINANWSVGLSARIYNDTGEVVPEGFNTAAPAVHSKEMSGSVAWKNLNTTVRLSAGVYNVGYDALPGDNQFFGNLYRDREFTLARLAISHSF